MTTYLAIVLLALLVLFMLAFHMIIVFWAIRRGFDWFTIQLQTANATEADSPETTPGLSREDVKKLPCYDFKNGDCPDGQEDQTSNGSVVCAVCLESFHPGEKCRLLPQCQHSFHAECVDSWLIKCPLCPICRGGVKLIKDQDHVIIGIPESS